MVPDRCALTIEHVWAPIDFSTHSADSLASPAAGQWGHRRRV